MRKKQTSSVAQVTYLCPKCRGSGKTSDSWRGIYGQPFRTHIRCPVCGGSGEAPRRECKAKFFTEQGNVKNCKFQYAHNGPCGEPPPPPPKVRKKKVVEPEAAPESTKLPKRVWVNIR